MFSRCKFFVIVNKMTNIMFLEIWFFVFLIFVVTAFFVCPFGPFGDDEQKQNIGNLLTPAQMAPDCETLQLMLSTNIDYLSLFCCLFAFDFSFDYDCETF